jgi:hypothetical protein
MPVLSKHKTKANEEQIKHPSSSLLPVNQKYQKFIAFSTNPFQHSINNKHFYHKTPPSINSPRFPSLLPRNNVLIYKE